MREKPGILLSTLSFRETYFGELQFTNDLSSLVTRALNGELINRKIYVDDKTYVKKTDEPLPDGEVLADEFVEYPTEPQEETEDVFNYKNNNNLFVQKSRFEGYVDDYLIQHFELKLPDLHDCVLRDGTSKLYNYDSNAQYNPPEEPYDVVPKKYIDVNLPVPINGEFIKTDGSVPMAQGYVPTQGGHLITKEFAEVGNMKIVLPNIDPGFEGALWNNDLSIEISEGPVFLARYYVSSHAVLSNDDGDTFTSNELLYFDFRSNTRGFPNSSDKSKVVSIEILEWGRRTSMQNAFSQFGNLKFILTPETRNGFITSYRQAFYNCYLLERIGDLDSSSATDFYQTFQGCGTLLCISAVNSESATNKSYMFYGTYPEAMSPNQVYRDLLMSTEGYNFASTCY